MIEVGVILERCVVPVQLTEPSVRTQDTVSPKNLEHTYATRDSLGTHTNE